MKKNKLNIFVLFAVILITGTIIYARATKYAPGATLNPDCSPGEANCTVDTEKIGRFQDDGTGKISYTGGNVGIGTTSPVAKLDVNGDLNWTTMWWDPSENIKMRGSGEFSFDFEDGDGNDYWHVWDPSHSAILVVRNNGRVGIGTTNPSKKLDVVGDINFTGNLYKNGALFNGGASAINDLSDGKTGGYSVFLGSGAGANDDGSDNRNTAIGKESMYANTTGYNSIAVGYRALYSNTTGYNNTANGKDALVHNKEGRFNVAVGAYALEKNTTDSSYHSGEHNVAIGEHALSENTIGKWNVAVGSSAGKFIDGGSGNQESSNSVYIGYMSKSQQSGTNNEIVIGDRAVGNGSNTVTLGNNSITKTLLKGNVGIGTTSPGSPLTVVSNSPANSSEYVANFRRKNFGSGSMYINLQAGDSERQYMQVRPNGNISWVAYNGSSWHHPLTIESGGTVRVENIIKDSSDDWSIGGSGENLEFREPEDGNKVWGYIQDDNGLHMTGAPNIYASGDVYLYDDLRFTRNAAWFVVDGHTRMYINGTGINRISTNYGYVEIGPRNSSYMHFYTDRGAYYFNKKAYASGGFHTYSDLRLKKDIFEIDNPLEKIAKIRGVYYKYRDKGLSLETKDMPKGQQVGVIAQEVEKVLPEVVSTDEEGVKSVDYSKLTPLLIEAIKKQQKEIQELREMVEGLKK